MMNQVIKNPNIENGFKKYHDERNLYLKNQMKDDSKNIDISFANYAIFNNKIMSNDQFSEVIQNIP